MALPLRHLIVATLFTASAACVSAQPAPPRTTLVRFYYYAPSDSSGSRVDPPLTAWLQNQKAFVPIEVPPGGLAPPVTYVGDGPVELFTETATGQDRVRKIFARLTLPAQLQGILYLVSHSPSEGFSFFPVSYSAEGIPARHVKVLNLCPGPLAVKIAGGQAVVPPQGEAWVDASASAAYLPVKVVVQRGEGWRPIIETAVPGLAPDARPLFVFVPDSPQFKTALLLQLGNLPETAPSSP